MHRISALETEYSLWSRDPEDEILPTVRELGIGFVAYSPLGRGFLSGRIRSSDDLAEGDFRRSNARFAGENSRTTWSWSSACRHSHSGKACRLRSSRSPGC